MYAGIQFIWSYHLVKKTLLFSEEKLSLEYHTSNFVLRDRLKYLFETHNHFSLS